MHIKQRASSNLINVDQSNFLANKTVRLVFALYVQNIIQINSRQKQNWKIVYCSLKNMSLHRIGAHADTNYNCQTIIITFINHINNSITINKLKK